ncbi:MAG: ABC transporter permease subunit [Clostridia bacterium]|nr:ABC transporter permease subunit [Clostridia bacterium]
MTVFFHELRRNRLSLAVWAAAIAFMLGISVLIYPQMTAQMAEINEVFADMGSFTAAFGMDKVSFGEFGGYFSIECGNVLGLGGALFAAILGISALAREEREHTAEFLYTHPLTRTRIVGEKLAAVLAQILLLNLAVAAVALLSMRVIGESAEAKPLLLLFLAYLLMQAELAAITFGVSAFLRSGGMGLGIGAAIMLYFLNILANITEKAAFLKFITPFGYTDGADIMSSGRLEIKYLAVGLLLAAAGVSAAFLKYGKKDI